VIILKSIEFCDQILSHHNKMQANKTNLRKEGKKREKKWTKERSKEAVANRLQVQWKNERASLFFFCEKEG